VLGAEVSRSWPSAGLISFVPDLQTLYLDYDLISRDYPGWGLSDMKELSYRERRYWKSMIAWRKERRGFGT
jgi:hypothetical protein